MNKAMQAIIGWLYAWENFILVAIILLSIMIYRPFCKYLGPLGAVYSVFNPVSVLNYTVSAEKCTNCSACAKACKMGCNPVQNANSLECIRCGKCKSSCPKKTIDIVAFQGKRKCGSKEVHLQIIKPSLK